MKRIEDKNSRFITFSKRRSGSVTSPARPYMKTRWPDRPTPGPTVGLMLKRIYELNRPGMCSGSRPDRSDRPAARSDFENLGYNFVYNNGGQNSYHIYNAHKYVR
ncbi:putative transcription factor MADS-type1 family [Helianthus anomalus]